MFVPRRVVCSPLDLSFEATIIDSCQKDPQFDHAGEGGH